MKTCTIILAVVLGLLVVGGIVTAIVLLTRNNDDDKSNADDAQSNIDYCENLKPASYQNCTDNPSLVSDKLPACCVPFEEYDLARFADGNAPRVEDSFPRWINFDLMRCGQQFARNNWFSIGLAAALGRAGNMNNYDIRDVAMFTKVMSTQKEGCAKILASFGAKLSVWFNDIQPNPPASAENNDFLQSVNRIRWLHIKLARDIESMRRKADYLDDEIVDPETYENTPVNTVVWDAFHQDLVNSNIPPSEREPPIMEFFNMSIPFFNQHSIALFQYNAFAYPVLMGKVFGIEASEEELWAFNHLNAIIGYTFGIDDKYNLALQPNIQALREYYGKVFRAYVLPGFFHVHQKTKVTIENIMEATRINTPAWTLQLYLYRVLTMLVGVPAPTLRNLFNDDDKFHDNNMNTNVLPNLLANVTFRQETNKNAISDLMAVGQIYYGENYTTQYGRARHTFLTPVDNL